MTDPSRRVDTVVLETTAPPRVDWSRAETWRVIVTVRGVPCSAFWVPGPGRLRDPHAFTEQLTASGRQRLAYELSLERFRKRMGIPDRRPPKRSCSVIVCTHRRSSYLPGMLAALSALDPAPDEVIVVDNDPGELDCRELVEAAGAYYVREDRRGLDNARNRGLHIAGGELVAFTDDDCVPSPGWLARLDELFAEPVVGAVTGPAFAYELVSPAQVRFEREGGFTRGLARRDLDWTRLSPLDAGATGAGANMVFRRELLDELSAVFPPELDAGTPTQSGGDLYLLYKVLAAGQRIVYDPGTYVFHRHRPDPDALHGAFFGYGVGLSATLAKLLVEEREPDALRSWWWLVAQYRTAQRERLLGRADARHVRVAWDHLRGGLHGPRALVKARAAISRAPVASEVPSAMADRDPRRDAGAQRRTPSPLRPGGPPDLTVIVPTLRRPEALARCLSALAAQEGDVAFEIIVVDDDPLPGPRGGLPTSRETVLAVEGGGRGAAAARNAGARAARGRILLFLDDDLVPAPDLVRRHLSHHRDGRERVVLGQCPPRPPHGSLMDAAAALWWQDRYRDMERSGTLTFTDVLSGNMSISAARFAAVGGFDEGLGRLRREDWQWGIRALEAGLTIDYDPEAVAVHEFVLTVGQRLLAAKAEGRGDASIARARPDLAHALPGDDRALATRAKQLPLAWALRRDGPRRVVLELLDGLERLRLRAAWFRLFQAAQAIEYARGRRDVHDRPRVPQGRILVVDADSQRPLPAPDVCVARLRLRRASDAVDLRPDAGRWNDSLARSLAAAAAEDDWRQRAHRADGRAAGRVTVLVGPAHGPRDRRRLLFVGQPGVEIRSGEGPPTAHWTVLDRLIRGARTEIVATVLPGVLVQSGWLDELAGVLDGERLALLMGAPADPSAVRAQPWLLSRFEVLPRYQPIGRPFGYVAIRRAHYLALGGFDFSVVAFGDHAPAMELAERALDRGLVVAYHGSALVRRGPQPLNPALRPEWQRQRARGALLAHHGPGRLVGVLRGAAPLVRVVLRGPKALGALIAFASGVGEALIARSSASGRDAAAQGPPTP